MIEYRTRMTPAEVEAARLVNRSVAERLTRQSLTVEPRISIKVDGFSVNLKGRVARCVIQGIVGGINDYDDMLRRATDPITKI